MEEKTVESLIIVGSGPAGLTASIYAARAGLRPVVLEGMESGGQLMTTAHVDNFPGYAETVPGKRIIADTRAQAERLGVRFVFDEVTGIAGGTGGPEGTAPFAITGMIGEYRAHAVLIATGASVGKTGLPGEMSYWGHGISACLTCDAAFYRGRPVVVVGEGQAAQAAKTYLSRVGDVVVAVLAPSEVKSFVGAEGKLTGVDDIKCDGVFLVTRRQPQTAFLKGFVALDEQGYVKTTERVYTSVPGVFAAGDCASPRFRQAVIAAGDGAYAALAISSYLH